jgi:hypothetical protein
MNPCFPVLSTISVILRVLGWLIAIASIAAIVLAVLELTVGSDSFPIDMQPPLWVVCASAIVLAVGGLAWGLVVAAIGEGIGVLFAIELNTRTYGATWDEMPDVITTRYPVQDAPRAPQTE